MNFKFLLTSLLILGMTPLPTAAAPCPEGNPRSTDYIHRKSPYRCEGIKSESLSGNELGIISIATRNLTSFSNTLMLQIPKISGGKNPKPNVIVKSLGDNYHYQLDYLSLDSKSSGFNFSWDTYVLKQAKIPIPPNSLRALASYDLGSQTIYVPVIVGQTNGIYEFVFYSQDRVKFTTFEILSKKNQKPIYNSTSHTNPDSGEIIFNWDGRHALSGRYELHYVAKIEQRNLPSKRIERRIVFEHNPSWFK